MGMAQKTVEISLDSVKQSLSAAQEWVKNYFANIDTYGMIAVGAIVLGIILIVVGIILF
jgi:hypothetical protein